jgi:hypothetical protein
MLALSSAAEMEKGRKRGHSALHARMSTREGSLPPFAEYICLTVVQTAGNRTLAPVVEFA